MTRTPFAHTLAERGLQPVYTSGMRCPGCWGRAWLVGRVLAECSGCGLALPLAPQERVAA